MLFPRWQKLDTWGLSQLRGRLRIAVFAYFNISEIGIYFTIDVYIYIVVKKH
jgi:hypothetical protein